MGKMADRINKKVGNLQPEKTPQGNTAQPNMAAPARLFDAITQAEPLRQRLAELEQEVQVLNRGTVRLDKLVMVEGRQRRLSDEEFNDLKSNLALNPLIHPIVVRPYSDGRYEIIAGHNRARAYQDLGREEIPATVQKFEGTGTAEAFYSNLFVSELSDFEKFKGFRLIQRETGESQVALAKKAGVSQTQLAKLFSFEKLPPPAIEILEQSPGLLGCNRAFDLAKGKPDRIVEALKRLQAGKFVHQEDAVAFALKDETVTPTPKPGQSIVVKQGQKRFAEIIVRGGSVNVRFTNEADGAGLLPKITELLRDYAKQQEGAED
jgi:ParB family chromosome partitioning protein